MNFLRPGVLFVLLVGSCSAMLQAQQVFSKTDFGYKGIFQPYDLPGILPLDKKDFVILRQYNKGVMELCRYDQYLFEVWSQKTFWEKDQNVPQFFLKGDSIVLYSVTTRDDSCFVNIAICHARLGNRLNDTAFKMPFFPSGGSGPGIALSPNHSKLLIYNFLSDAGSMQQEFFAVDLNDQAKPQHYRSASLPMSHGISVAHITNRGDILYAAKVVDSARIAISYKTYHSESWSEMQATYQSRDPSAILGSIQILPLGSTSYFISYSTHSGETLDALGVIGINVVLKSVLYSSLLPFTSEEIKNVYSESITLGGLPKKKTEMLPVALENYRLTQIMLTGKNSVILAVEQQETPTDFHRGISMNAMPWDFSINEEKAITSGDLLLFCYSDGGELLWKKSLRKWQTEMGTNLGLSYEADIRGTGLNLLGYIGKDFFGITIDVGSGLVTRKLNLLPGKNMLFTKRYSCWLDAYSVVLCGISPLNDGLRKLMLVEF